MNTINPNRRRRGTAPTVTYTTRPVCRVPGCESRAIFRGTCSPDHYRERALYRRAALLGIRIDSRDLDAARTAVADAERDAALARGLDEIEGSRGGDR